MAIDNYIKEIFVNFNEFKNLEKTKPSFMQFCKENSKFFNYKTYNYQYYDLNQYQVEFIKSIDKTDFTLIKKRRQIGISSILILYINYLLIYGESIEILLFSKDKDLQNKILSQFQSLKNLKKTSQEIIRNDKGDIVIGEMRNMIKIVNSEREFMYKTHSYRFSHFFIDGYTCDFKDFYYMLNLMKMSSINYNSKKIIIQDYGMKEETFELFFRDIEKSSKIYIRKIIIEKKENKITETYQALKM
jgi:hypothetical protein